MAIDCAELSERLSAVESAVDNLQANVSRVFSKIDNMYVSLNGRLAQIAEAMASAAELEEVRRAVAAVNGHLNALRGEVSSLSELVQRAAGEVLKSQERHSGDVKDAVRSAFHGVLQELGAIRDNIEESRKALEEVIKGLERRQAEESEAIKRLLGQHAQRLSLELGDNFGKAMKNFERIIATLDNNVNRLVEIYGILEEVGALLRDLLAIREALVKILERSSEYYIKHLELVRKKIEEQTEGFEKSLGDMRRLTEEKYDHIAGSIASFYTSISQRVGELGDKLSGRLDNVNKEIGEGLAKLREAVDIMTAAVEGMQGAFEAARSEILSEIRANMAVLEDYGEFLLAERS